MSTEDIFTKAYGEWGGHSGPGSTPDYTIGYRDFLATLMRHYGVRSVLDLGCGDWQSSKLIDWTGIWYFGVDAVGWVIASNKAKYEKPEHITFSQVDVHDVPILKVDLVIVKDVLQHWTNAQVMRFLDRLRASPARMALIVNCDYDDGQPVHRDIEEGGWRPLTLWLPPFNLVDAVEVFRFHTKSAVLWKRGAVARSIEPG